MVLAFSVFADGFLSVDNFWTVMRQISVNTCLSVGMTLVILTGGIDLSVGSILALSGAVMAGLLKSGTELETLNVYIGYGAPAAITIGILVGASLGLFNGVMITRFRVPPFVATLAMLTIARGLTKLYTGGEAITGLGNAFVTIGSGRLLGIPNQVWIAAGIVIAATVLLKRTRFGRYIYAVGGNEEAAKLSGLNVKRIKLMVYTAAGALSAVGGLIVTSRLNSATPIAGEGFELDSIAAVVIGGTSLSGGRGSVPGTVLGALIIGVLNSGLVIMGVDPFWQTVIKGFVILLAVVIDRLNSKE
jgi:ribose transport system permease protein